jgi:hypothetical protein
MWKQRAVTLCGCFAALPLLMGCASEVGGQPQAAYVPSGPAVTSNADGARVYAVGSGAPAAILVVLPGSSDILTGGPQLWGAQGLDVVTAPPSAIHQIAEDQEAVAARLIARSQAMADAPIWLMGPNRAIEAAMASLPPAGPGQVSGVVVTSMTSGAGTCSERMIYSYSGNGAPPKVSVAKSGNCPAGSPFGSFGSNPTIAPPVPAVRPNAPRVIEAAAPGLGSPAAVRQVAALIKSASPD